MSGSWCVDCAGPKLFVSVLFVDSGCETNPVGAGDSFPGAEVAGV
jgi:hypothetical protein